VGVGQPCSAPGPGPCWYWAWCTACMYTLMYAAFSGCRPRRWLVCPSSTGGGAGVDLLWFGARPTLAQWPAWP
jgi:hypothetical protein